MIKEIEEETQKENSVKISQLNFNNLIRGLETKSLKTYDSSGSYVFPPNFLDNLIGDNIKNNNFFYKYSQYFKIESSELHLIKHDDECNYDDIWAIEGEPISKKDSAINKKIIRTYAMKLIISLTEEMINDTNIDLENYFTNTLNHIMYNVEKKAFLVGDGKTQPEGILSSLNDKSSKTKLGEEKNLYNCLYEMYLKMEESYRENAIWIVNRKVFMELISSKNIDVINKHVSNLNISNIGMSLLNLPIYLHDEDTQVKCVLANLKHGYAIAERNGIKLMKDPYSNKPHVDFCISKKIGGGKLRENCFQYLV
jgi:HK97 family phage major capsid protein